jgi:hypothetical protein
VFPKGVSSIRARADAENRPMTQWEEQQACAYDRAAVSITAGCMLRADIKRMRKESERRPLCRQEIKALKIYARHFPKAQELLLKCSKSGPKKRKHFAEIVRESPRQEGETYPAWVRRIWNQCANYDTKCPAVITEELLQRCLQGSARGHKNNLPPIRTGGAKSFR